MSRNKKAPTVLRDLKIKSVSVVDQGANQHAHIKLAKRAEEEAPEANEKQAENDTAFFARIGQAVAKMFHLNPREDEEVEKEAKSFASIDGARKTFERIYRISDALGDSLRSIVCDEDLTDEQKAGMIVETADQAAQAIKTDIAGMFNGTAVSKGVEDENGGEETGGQAASENPSETAQTDPADNPETTETIHKEGEEIDMKFNTEAMTPEERAQFEDFQKRFGVEEEEQQQNPAQQTETPAAETHEESGDGDIYKGINPAVKAEIESLRKFREDAEEREIMEVAKRYTIIGKKPEELAPVLKGLKAAGGTAYADMIAVLDSAVQAVEKSGVFGEIGKRGNGGSDTDDAWGKIEVAAQEIVKSNSGMTYAQAIDKACMEHPDLLEAYEKSRK